MTVSLATLREQVGGDARKHDALAADLAEAATMVADYLGGTATAVPDRPDDDPAWTVTHDTGCPDLTVDRAVREVAADLWHRRKAPNGVMVGQFSDGGDATPVRITRDPMAAAYKLLGRYVVPF